MSDRDRLFRGARLVLHAPDAFVIDDYARADGERVLLVIDREGTRLGEVPAGEAWDAVMSSSNAIR